MSGIQSGVTPCSKGETWAGFLVAAFKAFFFFLAPSLRGEAPEIREGEGNKIFVHPRAILFVSGHFRNFLHETFE